MTAEKIPVISVIVPMYNTEKYVGECLRSICAQTLKNIEIIVVDDCSIDNSCAVVEKCMEDDKRISLFEMPKNSGCPGIPRNFGLDVAKGKYIYFVDSDDFLSEDVLEIFYNAAENFNADVVDAYMTLEYREINGKFETQAARMKYNVSVEKPTLETFDIAKRLDDSFKMKYSNMAQAKLFRRDFLTENNIKYPAMTITEDLVFMFQYVVCAKNYLRIPFIGYFYRKYQGSTSNSPRATKTSSLDLIEGVYFLDNFMRRQKFFIENPKYQYQVIDFFNRWFADVIFNDIFFNKDLETQETYDFYCQKILSMNPQKNIPLTAYLLVSSNIYKIFIKSQAEEIDRLKNLLQNK